MATILPMKPEYLFVSFWVGFSYDLRNKSKECFIMCFESVFFSLSQYLNLIDSTIFNQCVHDAYSLRRRCPILINAR